MELSSISSGILVFLDPSHVPALEALTYVTVVKAQVVVATARVVGSGAEVLQHRVVVAAEADLWPYTFVGHPLAFSGYRLSHIKYNAYLHVQIDGVTQRIQLHDLSCVIIADRLNCVLSIGAGVNVSVLKAAESTIIRITQCDSNFTESPYEPEECVRSFNRRRCEQFKWGANT
ncbi:Hypothetical protein PHPALM_8534 [Phytophthora palmivora]|uniref:Uncharacterized protein n=1 Tax=Phytophthora palmivora TaxID=4796 RepID=A0A2P4Y9L4_9STRA|nr:Hypothetical protein PHPALM_8534 [Phytophthora palmivora]